MVTFDKYQTPAGQAGNLDLGYTEHIQYETNTELTNYTQDGEPVTKEHQDIFPCKIALVSEFSIWIS